MPITPKNLEEMDAEIRYFEERIRRSEAIDPYYEKLSRLRTICEQKLSAVPTNSQDGGSNSARRSGGVWGTSIGFTLDGAVSRQSKQSEREKWQARIREIDRLLAILHDRRQSRRNRIVSSRPAPLRQSSNYYAEDADRYDDYHQVNDEMEDFDDLTAEGLGVGDVSFEDADSEY